MLFNINLFAQTVPMADGFQLPLYEYDISDNCLEWGGWGSSFYEGQRHLADDECSPSGTEVFASANGIVRFSHNNGSCPDNWGPLIVIESNTNNGSVCVIYGHVVSEPSIIEGGSVVRGQKIGKIADGTGCWSDHIHFGIYIGEYGMPNGEYPGWLRGYLFPGAWPGNYVDPIWYVENNPPSSSSTVGCFSTNDCSGAVSLSFQQKYNAMATAGHPLGNPWDNGGSIYVHEVNGMYIQDFQDPRDQGGPSNGYYHPYTALIYDAATVSTANVRLLKEGFWDTWMNNTGWVNFGSPITDEYSNGGEIWQTFRRYGQNYPSNQSDYENFYFTWNSNTQLLEVLDKNYNPVDFSQLTVTTADIFTRVFKSASLNDSTSNEFKQYNGLDYSLSDSTGGGSRLVSDTKISIAKVTSTTTEPEGVYHSGLIVSNLGQPFPLINQRDYDNFYAVINGTVIPIDPFTMNGDMTIYVGGSSSGPDIQFSHWTIYPNPGTVGQQIHVEGQINNQGSSSVTLSEVRVEFFDPNGTEIYHWSEYNVTLDPGYYWYQWLYCYPYISGNYTARFRGLINGQWQTYSTQTVYVQNNPNYPVADFTSNPLSGPAPLTVRFTDLSTNNPKRWQWLFGDGSVLHDVQNPQHTFVNPGTYTVDLLVFNDFGGDRIIKGGFITVYEAVVANFTSDVVSGSVPLTVHFTDQSTGNPTSWYWDFGDGNVSYDQHPLHTYVVAGIYSVSLTVGNQNSSNVKVVSNMITVKETFDHCAIGILTTKDNGGGWRGFTIRGNYAYVANGLLGLQIVNISNPVAPQIIGSVNTPDYAFHVSILDNYAYVSDGSSGLQIVNISNPVAPQIVGSVHLPDRVYGASIVSNFIYVFDAGSRLSIFDASNPASPTLVNSLVLPANVTGISFYKTYAYMTNGSYDLRIFDISNPVGPVLLSTKSLPGYASDVYADSNYVYVAAYASDLQIVDASNPTSPQLIGSLDLSYYALEVVVSDGYAYVVNVDPDTSSVEIIDISNPASPALVGSVGSAYDQIMDIIVEDGLAYMTDYQGGFAIVSLDCALPASPNFTATPKSGYSSLTVQFADQSTGNPTSWYWDFGDGTTSTQQNPQHIYRGGGNCTVSLTVSDGDFTNTKIIDNFITIKVKNFKDDRKMELYANHPNPFNPSTTISYSLPTSQHVSLVVYNILGQAVTTLVDGMKEAGEHSAIWDGRNDHGSPVSSGMYFYRLTTVESSIVRKMILLK